LTLAQHTRDWDARFRRNDTPWEDPAVAPIIVQLFGDYAPPGVSVLEIGCGLGTTAVWLTQQGYRVSACDIAPRAVQAARERAARAGVQIDFKVADVLADDTDLARPDVVFERGVLHTFVTDDGRAALAAAVARLLASGGLWLDVSGSADTPGDPPEAAAQGWPRLTLVQIARAAEPNFEVVAVHQAPYGSVAGRTDFLAFASVFRRR
jgi:SAM-dependent methyltransferase